MTGRDRPAEIPGHAPAAKIPADPAFEACGSWPDCDCRNHCEVRRMLVSGPVFDRIERLFLLALVVIGLAALAWGYAK